MTLPLLTEYIENLEATALSYVFRGYYTAKGGNLWHEGALGSTAAYGGDFVIGNRTASNTYTERVRILANGGVKLLAVKSGATQAGAGAAANELWKTASHASLPDNVVMIGV